MPAIPLELVPQIVRHLEDDPAALRNGSLTCLPFREPCQRLIFSTLELRRPRPPWTKPLHWGPAYTPGKRLLALFNESPAIAAYPVEITIVEDHPLTVDGGGWLSTDDDLAKALGHLVAWNKIRRLTLAQCPHTKWSHLSSELKEVIGGLCASTSLISLSLAWTPIHLLESCGPSLRTLKLWNVDIQKAPTAKRMKVHNLDYLAIRHSSDISNVINHVLETFSVGALKKLQIEQDGGEEMKQVLDMCKDTLETLALGRSVRTEEDGPAATVDLGQLAKLRRIGFSCWSTYTAEEGYLEPLPRVLSSLETIPPGNAVEDIHLTVDHRLDSFEGFEPQSWAHLDELLANKRKFPKLQRACIEHYSGFYGFLGYVDEGIGHLTPKLDKSDVVLTVQERFRSIVREKTFEPFP
ncbi:hypothetical protein CC2G_013885 [Coprinopsis cinerea AmutBmut pab1-1]|nr:hypothetical protein CC2G_013885 [Coprinopsis cinerea AmutBmut pab1-1]